MDSKRVLLCAIFLCGLAGRAFAAGGGGGGGSSSSASAETVDLARVFQWIDFAFMCVGIIGFLAIWIWHGHREYYVFNFLVVLIASQAYLLIALGEGSIDINGNHVNWIRYLDWSITTPMLVIDLMTIADASWSRKVLFCVIDWLMIATGFAAALMAEPNRWILYAFSCLFEFILLVGLYSYVKPTIEALPDKKSAFLFKISVVMFFAAWTVFPIVWAVGPEGKHHLSLAGEAILHAAADLVAKVLFGFIYIKIEDEKHAAEVEEEAAREVEIFMDRTGERYVKLTAGAAIDDAGTIKLHPHKLNKKIKESHEAKDNVHKHLHPHEMHGPDGHHAHDSHHGHPMPTGMQTPRIPMDPVDIGPHNMAETRGHMTPYGAKSAPMIVDLTSMGQARNVVVDPHGPGTPRAMAMNPGRLELHDASEVRVGADVYVLGPNGENEICRVIGRTPDGRRVRVRRYMYAKDVTRGAPRDSKLLFRSNAVDLVSVRDVIGYCQVVHISEVDDLDMYASVHDNWYFKDSFDVNSQQIAPWRPGMDQDEFDGPYDGPNDGFGGRPPSRPGFRNDFGGNDYAEPRRSFSRGPQMAPVNGGSMTPRRNYM
eukprot:tig00000865_g5067.t1